MISDSRDLLEETEPEGSSDNAVRLFVGQIPRDIDENQLAPLFAEFGPVAEIRIIRDKDDQSHKGCAFLSYHGMPSALSAVQQLHDKVKLPGSQNPLQVRIAESQSERENKLFVGMLPKTLNEQDLQDMFSPYGELKEVHVIRSPEGSSKGCAFVKFVDREAAIVAIADMNEYVPQGSTRPLVVKFADNKKQGIPTKTSKFDAHGMDSFGESHHAMPRKPQQDYWVPSQSHLGGNNPATAGGQQAPMVFSFGMNPTPSPHFVSAPSGSASRLPGTAGPAGMSQFMFLSNSGFPFPPNSAAHFGSPPGSPLISFPRGLTPSSAHPQQQPQPTQLHPQQHQQQQQQHFLGLPQQTQIPSHPQQPSQNSRLSKLAGGDVFRRGEESLDDGYQQEFYPDGSSGTGRGSGSGGRPPEGPPGANLFIYHLPRDLTDADLATLFAAFGNVISAKVFVDKKTSDSKGFGFVSYDSMEAAANAISAMNGFQIGSKRLKVQHKRTQFDNSSIRSQQQQQQLRSFAGVGGVMVGGTNVLHVHQPIQLQALQQQQQLHQVAAGAAGGASDTDGMGRRHQFEYAEEQRHYEN